METSSNQRRKTETAVLDSRGRPVGLLYDETNDKTIMARGSTTGATNVEVEGGTIDEVTQSNGYMQDKDSLLWIPVSSQAGRLRTIDYGYYNQIAEGNIADHYPLNKFGMNEDVGAAYESVWDGNTDYVYPTTATTAVLVGGAQDDAGGTGALTVNISGLDANYDEVNEDVTMAGAGGSAPTTALFLRVFRMKVLTAGSDGTNNAAITCTVNAKSVAIIAAGMGQTLMALWTVPAGATLYIRSWYANTSIVNKSAESRIRIKPFGGAWNTKRVIHINGSGSTYDWTPPLCITEKSDIEVQHKATAGGGDCASGFDGWYEF